MCLKVHFANFRHGLRITEKERDVIPEVMPQFLKEKKKTQSVKAEVQHHIYEPESKS